MKVIWYNDKAKDDLSDVASRFSQLKKQIRSEWDKIKIRAAAKTLSQLERTLLSICAKRERNLGDHSRKLQELSVSHDDLREIKHRVTDYAPTRKRIINGSTLGEITGARQEDGYENCPSFYLFST